MATPIQPMMERPPYSGSIRILVEAMQHSEQRTAKIDHVKHAPGRRVEIDRHKARPRAGLGAAAPRRDDDRAAAVVGQLQCNRFKPGRGDAREIERRRRQRAGRDGVTVRMCEPVERCLPDQQCARQRDCAKQQQQARADAQMNVAPELLQALAAFCCHRGRPAVSNATRPWRRRSAAGPRNRRRFARW